MSTIVETAYGRVEGIAENGNRVFRGVRYARPPIGALRFRAPEPPEPHTGVQPCRGYGPSAPQIEPAVRILPGTDIGPIAEDCLSLNVWTPATDGGKRPVLVWIHGGGFTGGSGSRPLYTDSPLVAEGDAVLVTINYRLGILGFTYLGEHDVPADANLGILDQVAALRWVRDNIAAFGGDPDNVTIFGESAGGMSVGTLLGTPSARGLFARAVAQSGAAHHVHTRETGARVAHEILTDLGLDEPEDAERLREVPLEKLLETQGRVLEKLRGGQNLLAFQPVVDGDTLPEPPLDAVRAGLSADVPLLVGTTRDEWNLFALMDPRSRELDLAGLVKRMEARVGGDARRLIDAYRDLRAERGASTEPPDLWCALETDRAFRIPAIRLAEAHAPHQRATYAYLFDWESPAAGGRLGSCHALEVPFVFGTLGTPGMGQWAGEGPDAERLSQQMRASWLGFARGADPAHDGVGAWHAYESGRRHTMILGPRCGLTEAPYDRERSLWEQLL